MSTGLIYESVYATTTARLSANGPIKHLDVGAGEGNLIRLLSERMEIRSTACDFHVERFDVPGVEIHKVNLNDDSLPFDDQQFDLLTCSEVVEHLENYRALIREAYRVLKPGGVAVFTTPNIINLKSRMRFLMSGFYNLFGPLPFKNDQLYTTGGHITPISYFHLAHSLVDGEFDAIELGIDKRQKSSLALSLFFGPLVKLFQPWFYAKENGRYKTLTEQNWSHVKQHFSLKLLVGRTIVVSAMRPPRP